ncbi:alpha/beta fold hydrolase [Nocardia camponoti]|uniref:Alpha/beta hydrolase n=1 Tax=Nocardia camponoti TaxID=1616106 RepID=A0A917QCA2_9NOCA|nr:alpha/beta hydrolase [Nocardia camponoti]GGK42435.1 alpha/beta hydrolase [Nocardia camponoti]
MSSFVRVGAGEPVLLLHGFTLSHHVWRGVLAELSGDYDLVALTMPGHWGARRLPWRNAGVRGIADGIERDLDELGWDTCHIVGNSLGGQVGFELERRGRARSLAAINAGVGTKRFDYNAFRVGVEFVLQYRLALATRVLGDRAATNPRFQRPVLANSARNIAAVANEDATNMMRAIANCPTYLPSVAAFARDGLVVDIDRVRAPTSILLSEFDIYPNQAPHVHRVLDRLPPHIREVRLPGVGHIPMLEAPAQVGAALREHFDIVARTATDTGNTR